MHNVTGPPQLGLDGRSEVISLVISLSFAPFSLIYSLSLRIFFIGLREFSPSRRNRFTITVCVILSTVVQWYMCIDRKWLFLEQKYDAIISRRSHIFLLVIYSIRQTYVFCEDISLSTDRFCRLIYWKKVYIFQQKLYNSSLVDNAKWIHYLISLIQFNYYRDLS